MPLGAAYRLTEWLLLLVYTVVLPVRRRARVSLELAYGAEQPARWRRRILWQSARYQGWWFVDMLKAPRLLWDRRYRDRVDLSELESAMREGEIGKGSGALLIGSHQGVPEVASLGLVHAGWPHAVVSRPYDNAFLWRIWQREHEGYDRPEFGKRGALRPALRVLRQRGIVGMQIDQDAGSGGVFVPFFGRPASTHPGAATLALLTDAPVYMFTCIRTEPRAFRFKVYCAGPLEVERTGEHDEDVLRLTAAMTREIEAMVRRFPEQFLWPHRRWKTRPSGRTDK